VSTRLRVSAAPAARAMRNFLVEPESDSGAELGRASVVASDCEREPRPAPERVSDSYRAEKLVARAFGHRRRARRDWRSFSSAGSRGSEHLTVNQSRRREADFAGERSHNPI